jgi:putative oxidoreductase
MSIKMKTILNELLPALLILLFAYTGIMKLINHDNFQGTLSQSDIVGKWSQILGWLIPITELVTAFLLLIPRTKVSGLVMSIVLMCVFTIYVFYMIEFMPHLPCNCGGVIKAMSWKQHLIFNFCFTVISILSYVISKKLERNYKINMV